MATTNPNSPITPFGNVLLIDPNLVNVNTNMTNAIPQYQDMFIFAELTAKRRGRTVLELASGGQTKILENGMNRDITVNFIGNNQDPDNQANYLNFTTNWYDGSSHDGKQFEGFGISDIKVIINSSFVPQVSIEFVDIRGLAFFSQADSPYRILFDFPPPIFELTLKGYYGMPLKYKLHLVKYTSEFKSETGNYVINAQFIAQTYAPLTDVLFRYIINFPLIDGGDVSISPNSNSAPKNTYELILKLKNLYTQSSDKKNTDVDTQAYNNILTAINNYDDVITVLASYATNDDLKSIGKPVLLVKNNSFTVGGINELTPLQNLSDYNNYIKDIPSEGLPNNIDQRLFIVYLINNAVVVPTSEAPVTNADRQATAVKALSLFRQNTLLSKSKDRLGAFITDTDLPVVDAKGFFSSENITINNPDTSNLYVGLDVTNFYVKLNKQRSSLLKQKTDAMSVMNEKINSMVISNLGMKPTIYNIFKLLMDDVDTFFRKLRITSTKAEEHHKANFNRILNGSGYVDTTGNIFAFPLIIKDEKVCNQIKQSRTSPITISQTLDTEFPELTLINDFIETFTKQKTITTLLNMRAEQNADGTFKWIPIAPTDSKLATTTLETPYYGVDNGNGGSGSQPINLSTDTRLIQVFKILLKRFYILSQNSYVDGFYSKSAGQQALVEMFSQSESINLATSISNKDYTNLLLTAAKFYGTQQNVQAFYDYVKTYIPDLYSFTQEEQPYLQISNGINVYTNKKNPQFEGFRMYDQGLSLRSTEGSNNPIDNFQNNVKRNAWKNFWNGAVLESLYGFTLENVFYIKDVAPDSSGTNSSGISSKTRFVAEEGIFNVIPASPEANYSDYLLRVYTVNNGLIQEIQPSPTLLSKLFEDNSTDIKRKQYIDKMISTNTGNKLFASIGAFPLSDSVELEMFGDVSDIWTDQLSKHDNEICNTIISGYTDVSNPQFNARLSALVLLSNFGNTLSPFNYYPHDLNKYIFNIPAAVEVPSFVPYYIGALVDVLPGTQEFIDIYNFFVSGSGKNLNSSGALIFADIIDINNNLSDKDKVAFKIEFERFFGSNGEIGKPFSAIIQQLKLVYLGAQQAAINATSDAQRIRQKKTYYANALNSSNGAAFKVILEPLLINSTTSAKNNIINYSQLTFKQQANTNVGYQSLEVINSNVTKKTVNDNYFIKFFQSLATEIQAQQTKLNNQEEENKKNSGDEDIINQTYYSFKNINDKWLTSPDKNNRNAGYPLDTNLTSVTAINNVTSTNGTNTPTPQINTNPSLIDSFVFVDRAMNPIGNTIINPEILINMMDNPEVSIFTVISQILSMNGFEFFPLQNFMRFNETGWEESFKIDTNMTSTPVPTFVCMYLGGSSSYPTGINTGGQFVDDGILDISNPGNVKDFSLRGCDAIPDEDNQTVGNTVFPYREVRAFRVKFAQQNQSMFKDIRIDSKEYPETNESIQILSRLAGDGKLQAPPPKGQNLYNLYENRSYRATISGLGNMMIQPTQYFQLENVPLFNGAYMILSVEHQIKPNSMTTNFSGTKILKYPVPRVLQSSAIVGFDGGNTNDTNPAASSADEVTVGVGTLSNPALAQFNSMYKFKIQ